MSVEMQELSQEGLQDLVGQLYEMYATDVLRVSYFYLGDRGKAEDVMQEVFIRLMRSKPKLEEGREKAWLLKVALNLCKDHWRSGWVKRVFLGDEKLNVITADDDPIEDRAEKEALLQAVHSLSPNYREVVLLFYYQGLSLEEIRAMTGIPIGTLGSRLARARKQLKQLLEGTDKI
jgi:RNA polymerase sigma-70 factor (ECF subfamily)